MKLLKEASIDGMVWWRNIDFKNVPPLLSGQVKGCPFTSEDWLAWADWYNRLPNIWNFALMKDEEVMAFIYGYWDPLERELRIMRLSIHPTLFSAGMTAVGEATISQLKLLAKELNIRSIIFETTEWRAWMRKSSGMLKLLKGRILGVA
jgi:hypothetical protein